MNPFPILKYTAFLGLLLANSHMPSFGQQPIYTAGRIYEETQIRTKIYQLGTGAMNNVSSLILRDQNTVPFGTDGIVGLATMIRTDNQIEVFPSHRLPGQYQDFNFAHPGDGSGMAGSPMVGAWGEYYRFQAPGTPLFRSGVANVAGFPNFFSRGLFPRLPDRTFASTQAERGFTKVEYVCTPPCGASEASAYYMKLGGWNMDSLARKGMGLPNGPAVYQIANLDAVIHSDDTAHTYIVDNISHLGQRDATDPALHGKGGSIWIGGGCVNTPCSPSQVIGALHVFAGAKKPPSSDNCCYAYQNGSYRGAHYTDSENPTLPTPPAPREVPIPYKNKLQNRGWVKIEHTYTGLLQQPAYAIKSKAVAIGPWDMNSEQQTTLPLSAFGISANRIVGLNTTIQSDLFYKPFANRAGWQLTDFNMHKWETPASIPGDNRSRGGGFTMIRGNDVLVVQRKDGPTNYYSAKHSQYSVNSENYNRGWVKIDYLAGSCEQGPPGFTVAAIPGTMRGKCTGASQPFYIEGAGRGTPNFAATDSMTYVYRTANTLNRTITVKVESMDANSNNAALAGVMFRSSLEANASNAAMVTSPSSTLGVYFRRRGSDNGQTQVDQKTQVQQGAFLVNAKPPCWVRLKKVGNTVTAYVNITNTNTMPTTWYQVGTPKSVNFPSTYYVGLQVSNYTSPKLSKAGFLGYSEVSP